MSSYFLISLLVFIKISSQQALTNVTLTHSSKSSKIVSPSNPRAVQYVVYNYPSKIKQVPEASWIWAGYGNQPDCPMSITIQDEVSVTCLMQPMTLYASADNYFTATFFGESLSGNSWSAPVSKTINPKGKTCNGTYKFTITATNQVQSGKSGCEGGNWAAVIYGVIQQRPDICCQTTAEYYDPSTCECYPCKNLFDAGCTNCTPSSCTKCNATANFILSGSTCVCKSDQYLLNVSLSQCILCNNYLDNCTNCNDNNTCTKCQVGYKLNPFTHKCEKCQVGCLVCDYSQCFLCDTSKQFQLLDLSCKCNQSSAIYIDQCRLCSVMISNCTSCDNGTFCRTCENRSMVNLDSSSCQVCPIGCSSCQHFAGCLTCDNGYYLNLGECISHCGDGILLSSENEECDDGNLQNEDGCSSNCNIQKDYFCDNVEEQRSNCSYSASFKLFVIWVKKQYYMNRINISIGIRPHIQNLNLLNFHDAMYLGEHFANYTYFYNQNGTVFMSYDFKETVEGKHYLLIFSPSQTSPTFLHTPSSTVLVEMTTNSNIPITFYDQKQEYQSAVLTQKLVAASIFFSYFLLFGSFFTNKIATLELFLVWQVSFFSLGTIDKAHPFLSTIFQMRRVNAYNWIDPQDNRHVPDRVNAIRYSGDMYQNFNLNFLFLILASVMTPIINFISWSLKTKSVSKLKNILQHNVRQYSFYFVVFSTINIGYSSGVQLLYGEINAVNTVILFFSITLLFLSFLLFTYGDYLTYGQFYNRFKPQMQSQLYFVFNVVYRFLLGFILAIFNQSPYVTIYSLFLSISFLSYEISVRPFKTGYQNHQSILCQLTISIILCIRTFYRSFKNQYPIEEISKILNPSYFQFVMIAFCMFAVFSGLIFQTISKFYSKKKIMKQIIKKQQARRKKTIQTNDFTIDEKSSESIEYPINVYVI